MGIADLGCSTGPNTLSVISEIIDVIYSKCCHLGRPPPELRISLNDLYSNDFNDIFVSLPDFYNKMKEDKGTGGPRACFISGVPGSFYGRLFPSKSLHFVHSSSSLHWLSQAPPGLDSKASVAINKGKVYISKSSPQSVLDSYSLQFQKDFSMFLKSRSEEVVLGGRIVLSLMGRSSMDPTTEESCHHWELLAHALMSMVSEGLIPEEKVDTFNAPYYAPCAEEVKLEIQKEGSFIMDRLEAFDIDWDGGVDACNSIETLSSGQRVAKTIRAVVESMLEPHFGREIMDDLFRRYAKMVDNHLSKTRTKYMNLVVSFIRVDQIEGQR
ncbi:hypothetical protein FH972_013862 [Carpinus fangiana]|uniref:Jasmonate O-methyltransferase n=1 Tax=Carpinus fangiana TaxID=176857 RepID=A0A5N6R806_9ROSI|nr:hypothetical protein FH972_013862 [Carpinus fangiana]